tara:strand:- start:1723 stop:1857 length:135 start_codon:yes stop_codon:yes gene_type:complete
MGVVYTLRRCVAVLKKLEVLTYNEPKTRAKYKKRASKKIPREDL